MALTKQYTVSVDLTSRKQTSNSIEMVILDTNVYSVVMSVLDNAVALDLTPYTVELLLDNNPLPDLTVTDTVNGQVTILFNDVSTLQAGKVYSTVLRLTEGGVVRHYHGFNLSTRTLP